MSTDAVRTTGLRTLEEYQKQTKEAKSGSDLSMDNFLKLFVAQLSLQDPLSGSSESGSGTDYISQMAQLTMLEQFSALNKALSVNQAYSMIGKYVYVGDEANGNPIIGRVDGVINEGGNCYLMVGGKTYGISSVYCVINETGATEDQILKSANLIGKTVTASVTKDGEETTITGKVDKISVKDGVIYLVIGDQEIALGSITEISAEDADA